MVQDVFELQVCVLYAPPPHRRGVTAHAPP